MKANVMVNAALALAMMLCFSTGTLARDIDPNKKPVPLPVKDFTFPNYEEVSLKNGLKVFIIEDNEQPTIAFRMQVHAGTAYDGELPGTADAAAGILTKGAGKRNALEVAQTLDGIGAGVSANAAGEAFSIFASGLKKHTDIILEVFSDVVLRPAFTQDEFGKFKTQWVAGLKSQKANSGTVAQNLARKIAYGENHPYARRATEKTAENVTLDAVRAFHKAYFKPNNATLAVVGDISKEEILPLLEKTFGSWQKEQVPQVRFPQAKSMDKGVYFVERPTSVQSSVLLTGLAVSYKHPDFEAARMAGYVMGIGFGGRLFRTLRETYSYTYTPYGFVTQAKRANRFACGADVRNEVTDSTIFVIKRELKELTQNAPEEAELNRIKRFITGTFLMSFENTQFVASQLQNAVLNDVTVDYIKNFPDRTMKITATQVQQAAAKYMNPDNLALVVVGSPAMMDKVEQFGDVTRYNIDLEEISDDTYAEVGMSWEELLLKHVKALGGESAVKGIKTLETKSEVAFMAQGQKFTGKSTRWQKPGAMAATEMAIPPIIQSMGAWCNGKQAWQSQNGQPLEEATDRQLESALFNSLMYPRILLEMGEVGFTPKLVGKKDGNIIVHAKSQKGALNVIYLDEQSLLVERIESAQETAQGSFPVVEEFTNFVKTQGVMLPANIKQTIGGAVTIDWANTYAANVDVKDDKFLPPGKNN